MEAALDLLRPGASVYVPGASGASAALADAFVREPGRLDGVHVVSVPFPGINEVDHAGLSASATATVFLPPAAVRASVAAGRTRVLPLSYAEIAAWLGTDAGLDVAFAHVAPPGPDGLCSLGIAADFAPIAWAAAKRRVLLVNPAMPAMRRGPRLPVADADVVVEAAGPIVTIAPPRTDPATEAIGRQVAALVPNGAAIQIGLGNAPAAAWRSLCDHRDLVLRSGMVADGFLALLDAGALREGEHVAGVVLGGDELIRRLVASDIIRLAPVTETHDVARLALVPRFTAINGAIEVDLFGQINLEWQDSRMVSGVGGAPDFARGALASPGGRSITVLPATARGGGVSRIVPCLAMPASLGRREADTIVTEHGVAELRCASIDARAEALIAIAAPEHRPTLATAWEATRARMWKG